MQKTFTLPATPNCKVVYVRDAVLYSATIPTPRDNTELQAVMLGRRVGMGQIQCVNEVQPRPEFMWRPSPAQSQVAKLGLPTY